MSCLVLVQKQNVNTSAHWSWLSLGAREMSCVARPCVFSVTSLVPGTVLPIRNSYVTKQNGVPLLYAFNLKIKVLFFNANVFISVVKAANISRC